MGVDIYCTGCGKSVNIKNTTCISQEVEIPGCSCKKRSRTLSILLGILISIYIFTAILEFMFSIVREIIRPNEPTTL